MTVERSSVPKTTPRRHNLSSDVAMQSRPSPTRRRVGLVVAGLAAAALVWAYWFTITDLFKEWQRNQDYSVGQLVPLVAVYLLWRRRRELALCQVAPCWWALVVILPAQAVRFYGLVFLYESAQRYALVLSLIGLVLLLAGRQVFRRTFWIWLFLFVMVPLPGRVHNAISGPLQTLAAKGAVFTLEVFGMAVAREGNVIVVSGIRIAVAEACSGLRMLTAFVVVAATMAFLVDRARWQRAALVISSVPIAIASNLARLCVTVLLWVWVSSEVAEKFFHDFAGLAMMPLAIAMMLAELWLMKKLVIPEDKTAAAGSGGHGGPFGCGRRSAKRAKRRNGKSGKNGKRRVRAAGASR